MTELHPTSGISKGIPSFWNLARRIQSALTLLGAAGLVGDAAEVFWKLQEPQNIEAMNDEPGENKNQQPAGVRMLRSADLAQTPAKRAISHQPNREDKT